MITQEQKDTLNEYAKIKSEIKLLEVKADELNPKALNIIQESGAKEVQIAELGKLSLASRRTWKYPKVILDMEDSLKAKKKEAEQRGTADYVEKHYLLFKGNKEE